MVRRSPRGMHCPARGMGGVRLHIDTRMAVRRVPWVNLRRYLTAGGRVVALLAHLDSPPSTTARAIGIDPARLSSVAQAAARRERPGVPWSRPLLAYEWAQLMRWLRCQWLAWHIRDGLMPVTDEDVDDALDDARWLDWVPDEWWRDVR